MTEETKVEITDEETELLPADKKRLEVAQMKARKRAAQAAERAQKAEERKRAKKPESMSTPDKDDATKATRHIRMMRAGRIMLWVMIGFIALRGVVACLQPNSVSDVRQAASEAKAALTQYSGKDNAVMAFAQNFSMDYMTYTDGEEADYLSRISRWASDTVTNSKISIPDGTSTCVVYAQAYRDKAYSSTQTDVWVLLWVKYTTAETAADGTASKSSKVETTILKVPVASYQGRYIVEDTPLFVNDSVLASNYVGEDYASLTVGEQCSGEEQAEIETTLTNFFTAYYGTDQSLADYYLLNTKDTDDFLVLGDRLTFEGIKGLHAYSEESGIVTIVTVSARDQNGTELVQNYNLHLQHTKGRYYVTAMDARTLNVKMEG